MYGKDCNSNIVPWIIASPTRLPCCVGKVGTCDNLP